MRVYTATALRRSLRAVVAPSPIVVGTRQAQSQARSPVLEQRACKQLYAAAGLQGLLVCCAPHAGASSHATLVAHQSEFFPLVPCP